MPNPDQHRRIRMLDPTVGRPGHGYFMPGDESFPEDPNSGEVAETWRNRGYGGTRGMRDAYHYRRGDIGGMGYGDGSMGYTAEPRDQGQEPGRRPWPRVGPKNYRRTDARICDEVCERLARARGIDVSDVTVDVGSGIVTLTGTIADRRAKFVVEDIADQVSGVQEVRNNLRVPR